MESIKTIHFLKPYSVSNQKTMFPFTPSPIWPPILKATSRKRCKIRGKLVLITNRKSIFVPKSVTLDDLERRNGP